MEIFPYPRCAIHEPSPSAGLAKAPEKGYNMFASAHPLTRALAWKLSTSLSGNRMFAASCSCLRICFLITIITGYPWKCKPFREFSTKFPSLEGWRPQSPGWSRTSALHHTNIKSCTKHSHSLCRILCISPRFHKNLKIHTFLIKFQSKNQPFAAMVEETS